MNLARIHRLLQRIGLLQVGRGYNTESLALECGVSRRTIFRDLEVLRQSGIPLAFDERQQHYCIPGSCLLPPTNFTPEEALSLVVLCHELGNGGGLPFLGPAQRGRQAGKQPALAAAGTTPRRRLDDPHPAAADQSACRLQTHLRATARRDRQPPRRAHPLR